MRRILAAYLAMLLATNADAQTDAYSDVAATIKRWGLLGTYSLECPPSDRDWVSYEIDADGKPVYRFPHPDKNKQIVGIEGARADERGSLILRLRPPGAELRTVVIAKGTDGTIRALMNRSDDGTYTVRDGISLGRNQPTQNLKKCS